MTNGNRTALGCIIFVTIVTLAASIAGQAADQPTTLPHPQIVNPAALSGDRANAVYRAIRTQMQENYARSGDPITLAYQTWNRFNRSPYRSKNHGERFVNHYANRQAADYGRFEELDPLPTGAIVIKDSFTVTESGSRPGRCL